MLIPVGIICSVSIEPETGWMLGLLGVLLHVFMAGFVTLHSLRAPREPRSALLWIMLTWIMPVIGFLLYLTVGINRVPVKHWQKKNSDQTFWNALHVHDSPQHPLAYWQEIGRTELSGLADSADAALNRILDKRIPSHPLLGGNSIKILTDGSEAYYEMLSVINGAKKHIHIQSYIIAPDKSGRMFMDALAARANAGVNVRVIYDSYGSAKGRLTGFFRSYRNIKNLSIVGFTQVNPIKRQFQINLRNHRKLLIVDGRTAFIGGMNISKDNLPGVHTGVAVHDHHFEITGPAVLEIQYTFLRDWYYMTDEDAETLLSREHFPEIGQKGKIQARIINAGPSSDEVIGDVYFNLICGAQRQIILATPYLVPPDELRCALRAAALRGVDVRIITPERGNNIPAHFAARAVFDELLDAGVRIFLRKPPFMHSKFVIVDCARVMLGTANFDNRSIKLNYETNLMVFDHAFAGRLKETTSTDFEASHELTRDEWLRRKKRGRIVENFFNLFSQAL